MNTLKPLVLKVRKLLESRFLQHLRPAPVRRVRFEVQLEFPWRERH